MNRRFWLYYELQGYYYSYDIMGWLYGIIKGYFGGGDTGSKSSEIDGIQFSDESAINPSTTLAVARSTLAGVQSGSL